MKLAVLVVVAACRAGSGSIVIGDGGGDAGTGDGGASITGRVCLLSDLRKLTTCSATGAKGLVVSLGTRTLTLGSDQDDGAFTIVAPPGTDLTWHVKSPVADRIVTSVMPFSTDATIPVIGTQTYTALRGLYGAGLPVDQQGSVVVRVVRGGSSIAGVAASTSLDQNNPIFYDGNPALPDDWGMTQTGPLGVVWLPGVSLVPSTAKVTLKPQGAAAVDTLVTVEDQAITFVTKELP